MSYRPVSVQKERFPEFHQDPLCVLGVPMFTMRCKALFYLNWALTELFTLNRVAHMLCLGLSPTKVRERQRCVVTSFDPMRVQY